MAGFALSQKSFLSLMASESLWTTRQSALRRTETMLKSDTPVIFHVKFNFGKRSEETF
jgi:hypothetical protein